MILIILLFSQCNSGGKDGVTRLNAALPPAHVLSEDLPISNAARMLLRCAVRDSVSVWKAKLERDPTAKNEVVTLLGSPGVLDNGVWLEEFGARVPRGVVARMACRLKVPLHTNAGFFNDATRKSFVKETKRIRDWYKTGRRAVKPIRLRCKRIRRTS